MHRKLQAPLHGNLHPGKDLKLQTSDWKIIVQAEFYSQLSMMAQVMSGTIAHTPSSILVKRYVEVRMIKKSFVLIPIVIELAFVFFFSRLISHISRLILNS